MRESVAARTLPSSFRRRPESSFPSPPNGTTPDSGLRRNDGDAGGIRVLRAGFLAACAFVAAFLSIAPAFGVDPLPFKDRAEELRFQALTRQLRCLVCQNESLADSNAPLAADLRRDVFEQIQAGKSDDEIKDWLTARYSDFVLYDPPLKGSTVLLWFGPALLLLAGAATVAVIVRRRARVVPGDSSAKRVDIDEDDDW